MSIKKINLKGSLEAIRDFRLPDMDSPSNWTEEHRKRVKDSWDASIPKMASDPSGVVMVYGTGGVISNEANEKLLRMYNSPGDLVRDVKPTGNMFSADGSNNLFKE